MAPPSGSGKPGRQPWTADLPLRGRVGDPEQGGVRAEPRLDLPREVGELGRFCALARQHDRHPGGPGRLDGEVRRLIRAEPAEKEREIVLIGPERECIHADRLCTVAAQGSFGAVPRWASEMATNRQVLAERLIIVARIAGRGTVDGHDGRSPAACGQAAVRPACGRAPHRHRARRAAGRPEPRA